MYLYDVGHCTNRLFVILFDTCADPGRYPRFEKSRSGDVGRLSKQYLINEALTGVVGLHPIQRRYLTEELIRLRRADERHRFAASQRRGRIDPNPHQIDAVIFALRRIPEGGCILADEVGLGKTIEAGLVLAQLLAEGMQRVLLILPKPLVGQWRDELYTLFGLETREGDLSPDAFMGSGIFLVGREFAGSTRGASLLNTSEPFDLCIIDEAHELFAGIYKRVDRYGHYKEDSKHAQTAHRVRSFLGMTPVLLLTATPIQNTLPELWSLVQYVDPSGTLLGRLPTFKAVFCAGDPRRVQPDQAEELRRRIATVCKRTLRRQAQEFLKRPFVERRAQLFEYTMSTTEKALYNDITAYLLERDLCAFYGNQRKLLLISFHKLMASSHRALAKSLRKVAERLQAMLRQAPSETVSQPTLAFALELEEVFEDEQAEEGTPPAAERIRAELKRVEDFARRAESLESDSKADCLRKVLKLQAERQARAESSGKILVFTESLTTQEYIREVFIKAGLDPGDITLFRGQNKSKEAREALKRWELEVGSKLAPNNRPSSDIAVRLALVHEFKTRTRVLISTEAGAKGLNLQFCDTLVNYDLPWNPQRIEQRIGRCHRYGQERDVTVINFLAKDNEAQRLIFEILSRKLDLFGKILDASDVVLHQPSGAASESLVSAPGIIDFESLMRRIYEQSRTQGDIEAELRNLRESIDEARERFENTLADTASLIQDEFDEGVRRAFQQIQEELPESLAALDLELDRILTGYLEAIDAPYERRCAEGQVHFIIAPCRRLPAGLEGGTEIVVGHARDLEDADPLHPGHPLILGAVEEARASTARPLSVKLSVPEDGSPLASRRGARGRYVVTKIRCEGFEPQEHLLVAALLEGENNPLPAELARACLDLQPEDHPDFEPPLSISNEDVEATVSEAVFEVQAVITQGNQDRFEQVMDQLERYVEDQLFVLRNDLEAAEMRLGECQIRRSSALASTRRDRAGREAGRIHARVEKLLAQIDQLERREDGVYQQGRASAHQKRYAQPETTIVLDVEFELT